MPGIKICSCSQQVLFLFWCCRRVNSLHFEKFFTPSLALISFIGKQIYPRIALFSNTLICTRYKKDLWVTFDICTIPIIFGFLWITCESELNSRYVRTEGLFLIWSKENKTNYNVYKRVTYTEHMMAYKWRRIFTVGYPTSEFYQILNLKISRLPFYIIGGS